MNRTEFYALCNSIGEEVDRMLPDFLAVPEDFAIGHGNVVLYIMNDAGDSVVRAWGPDRVRLRGTTLVATKKALQVWLTGYATLKYEQLVFSGKVEANHGISHPDMLGWEGGLEAKTIGGERLVFGFSGMRGEQDTGIVRKAAANLKSFTVVDHD